MQQMVYQQDQTSAELFQNKTVHIFGACGAEGAAVLHWIQSSVPTAHIVAHDTATPQECMHEWQRTHEGASESAARAFEQALQSSRVTWALADGYETPLGDDDIIFLPQSWFRYERNNFLKRFFTPELRVRDEYVSQIWTITRLYATLSRARLVMVTGADGKTTTTRMIGAIVRAYGASVGSQTIETGNDRTHEQQLDEVAQLSERDFLVLEVSDRQLSFGFPFQPDVAVVTNVTANKHMNDYGGFDAYVQVKGNVLRWQQPHQYAVLNADDAASRSFLATVGAAERRWVSLHEAVNGGVRVRDGVIETRDGTRIMSVDELGVSGQHNWYNACAALAAADALGVDMHTAAQALRDFSGVPHRLQTVRLWRGITLVEDSAGGNPVNVAVTIRAFSDRPLVLIVGGYRPDMTQEEIEPILSALAAQHTVHDILLIGQAAPQLHEFFSAVFAPEHLHIVQTLDRAFAWVQEHTARLPHGTVVCMTPGFESFDQYREYRARAAHFIELAHALPE